MNKVSLYGGLGNQMFQYVANVALNEKGVKSQISILDFLVNRHHNGFDIGRAFDLELPFPLNLYNFTIQNARFLLENRVVSFFSSRFLKIYLEKKSVYRENKEFVFDKNIFNQEDKFLIGTWQDTKYFQGIEGLIKRKFQFKKPKDKINERLISEIKDRNAVSIHVRRGDYTNDQWAGSHFVIRDEKYFLNAVNHIESKVDSPHFYVFSDDIKWVKANIKIANVTFVDHNSGRKSFNDMFLMSLCRHNIISNSTFSWWAAWLNKNENKTVIMPDKWLIGKETPGIFPDNWVKIKT
jgi:hypothetical protein